MPEQWRGTLHADLRIAACRARAMVCRSASFLPSSAQKGLVDLSIIGAVSGRN